MDSTDLASTARLRQRITALQVEIAAAEKKKSGIGEAITSRRKTLSRLQAQFVLNERGGAPSANE